MHIGFLYLIGITLGRLTSILVGRSTRQRDFINVCVGIIGALFGGLFVARAVSTPVALGSFNGGALLLSTVTAASLLALLTLLRRWSSEKLERSGQK